MAYFGDKKEGKATKLDFYLKWKGAADAGKFVYWDGEAEVEYKLEEFIVLRKGYAIKGWSEKHGSNMYSNQIDNFNEELNVRAGENDIVSGVYSDIKGDVLEAGWKIHLVLTCLTVWGDLIQIPLKGAAFASYLDFDKENNTNEVKVKFDGFEDGKKGAVKYRTPKFATGADITDAEADDAIQISATLKGGSNGSVAEDVAEISEEELPF